MTPATVHEFVRKWTDNKRSERSASQEQFIDLCHLFEHQTPNEDATGDEFAFEKGAERVGGKSGQGWADVWKRNYFAWEYKGAHKDLEAALKQLLQYRGNLDNPPLLVVSDMKRFVIHTNWTNTPDKRIEITLEELESSPAKFEQLRDVFKHPDRLKPTVGIDEITQEVAKRLATIAVSMSGTPKEPGRYEPLRVARFLDRVVFTLFAEDVDLLPDDCFTKICEGDKTRYNPQRFATQLRQLWSAMEHGGDFGPYPISHFNGGLFRDVEVLEPTQSELDALREAAKTNWRNVDASIFGTLFERALDPEKRAQLGAHYTSRQDILDLLNPVLLDPLRNEWRDLREKLTPLLDDPTPRELLAEKVNAFGERLTSIRVFDPACGSGNFLYIALQNLKDIEQSVRVWMHDAKLKPTFGSISPANFHGIELNVYAHDLAATTLQIGWLQWLKRNGAPTPPEPILQAPVDIQNRDALLDFPDPDDLSTAQEATWPDCDVIVGNPPFLGDKMMRRALQDDYVNALKQVYRGRVPGTANLVTYWFEKARAKIEKGSAKRAGFVATTAIKQINSRPVLDRIKQSGDIFFAISERDWILDGANLRIAIVGFDDGQQTERTLNEQPASTINADLTGGLDLTSRRYLPENNGRAFMGTTKVGDFDMPSETALPLLYAPNINGRPSSDVLRPYVNGDALTSRGGDTWIIDFGVQISQADASLYDAPFAYVEEHVKPKRTQNNRPRRAQLWWLLGETIPGFRNSTKLLPRYLATPHIAEHCMFVWLDIAVLPDSKVIAFAYEDDYHFGVLQSRPHTIWTEHIGGRHGGERRTYNPNECFLTFPFPRPTAEQEAAIGEAARVLNERREAWLNPSEWMRDEEITFRASLSEPWGHLVRDADANGIGMATYRRRVMRDPKQTVSASKWDAKAKQWRPTVEELQHVLPRRTLTMLYNERPAWLASAHAHLDAAVCAAYGLSPSASDEEVLAHLLALNAERASAS